MEQEGIPLFISVIIAVVILGAIIMAGIVLLAVFSIL